MTDFLGLLLSVTMLLALMWRFKGKNNENKTLLAMIICVMICCVSNFLSVVFEGTAGMQAKVITYVADLLQFAMTGVIGALWLSLVSRRSYGELQLSGRILINVVGMVSVIFLAVNFHTPVIFGIDENNEYYRGPFYILFTIMYFLLIAYGLYIYFDGKRKAAALSFFPVWQFAVPLAIGIVIQSVFQNVSMIWPCMAISVCSLVISLQNEVVFIDSLTGLYNRAYLDNFGISIRERRDASASAVILDMNGFKRINDVYGHGEGDAALIAAAGILSTAAGKDGKAIRYAGDEFVIMLRTDKTEEVESFIRRMNRGFEEHNRNSGKGYELSASYGYAVFNLKEHSIDELMNEIDHRMYENKRRFYAENSSHDRRSRG